jgi:signal transduction histidine kinase
MHRTGHGASKPTGAQAASIGFAPTALDQLLDRTQRAAPQLSRASDIAVVGTTCALTFVDGLVWATDPVVDTGRLSTSLAFLVPFLGALATVAVTLRRRHLRAALAVLAAASVALSVASWVIGTSLPPSLAALFALALLTTIALRREPGRTAVVLTAVAGLAVAAEALRPMVASAGYLLVACEIAFAAAVGVGIYLRWTDWRRMAAAQAARADERVEIAREVHDMVGHHVTAMVVQAQAAQHVAGRQPGAAAAALGRIEATGNEALASMHQLVGGLRTDVSTAPTGTWDDVDRLIDDARAHGQPVRASIDSEAPRVAPALAPSVHRLISESLTNIRRHARRVTRVDIIVAVAPESLLVTVSDDGDETGATVNGGFGIVGMQERAVALGGTLTAGPAPTGGWTVYAELPIERNR